MKRITLKAILMALFFTTTLSFSQTNSDNQTLFGQELTDANIETLDEFGKIRCGSVEYEQYLKSLDPQRATKEEFESWLAPKIEEIKAQRSNGTSILMTLPVVYHIITDGFGSENMSEAAIQAQNDQLNLDFSNSSGSPFSVAADTEVQFCLATQNETGSTLIEPGINRITDFGDGPFERLEFENTIKPQTQWDPTRYFNIWVGDLGDGLLGYAQFPIKGVNLQSFLECFNTKYIDNHTTFSATFNKTVYNFSSFISSDHTIPCFDHSCLTVRKNQLTCCIFAYIN